MPGHKGTGKPGCESLDITEIPGANSLYAAGGILAESEKNAAVLFGTEASFYSAEGSSLCVRAMLFLACMLVPRGKRPVIVAGRNAHSSFIHAAAMLDFEIVWLLPQTETFSLCSCPISPGDLQATLENLPWRPTAVFVTSPDYLGATLEIAALAKISHGFTVSLLVDNAHSA